MNIFLKKKERLTIAEAEQMLLNFNVAAGNHNTKIVAPRSGDVVFYWSNNPEKYKDWLADGFKWRNQGGKKQFPVDNPVLFKSYYHIIDKGVVTNNIIKDAYTLIERPMPVLIHYLKKNFDSDSDIESESGPHGNTKDKESAQNYERTLPSVLSQLKEKVSKRAPNLVYKDSSKKNGARDLKQVQNLRYAVNCQKRFTYDEIANCHLMHISLGFPNHIMTAPDIRIIGIDEVLLNETKKTLLAFNTDNRVCFQFDTTFNLTGYYVSVLLYIHPILVIHSANKVTSPVIPLAFFYHEKKFERSHNEFWRYISEVLPEISEYGFIITDCERGFRNAIKKYFPSVPLLRCWNHFWKATERWIQKNKKISTQDIGFYCESLRELFLQPTQQTFEIQLNKKKIGYTNNSGQLIAPWKKEFIDYYDTYIGPEIHNLAAYSVRPIAKSLFNHFTGITTNHSEGLNNLLKLINERVELPLDIVILSTQHLLIYYCNEIKMGFGNRGIYRLKPEFKEMCFVDTRFIEERDVLKPAEIVKSLKSDKVALLKMCGVKFVTISASEDSSSEQEPQATSSEQETQATSSTNSELDFENDMPDVLPDMFYHDVIYINDEPNVLEDNSPKTLSASQSKSHSSKTIKEVANDDTSDDETESTSDKPFELKSRYNSKVSRALWFIEKEKIRLDFKLKLYFVTDEANNCQQVKLLPKPSCTCLEKTACAHILAVQSINGIDISNSYKIPNITALTKSKNSGATGRKKKGHLKNSVEEASASASKSNPSNVKPSASNSDNLYVKSLLTELLKDSNEEEINIIVQGKSKIKVNMIRDDQSELSDLFLKDFDLKQIANYFNKSGLKKVRNLIEDKIRHCRCKVCSQICFENSIECDSCKYWFHFDCAKLGRYYRSGKAKEWLCSKSGFECLDE